MKKKSGDRNNAINKISKALEIPAIISQNSAHIELMDNTEAIIDGVSGVILYDESEIRLSVGRREIKFSGQNLELRTFNDREAVVVGEILSVEFE